MSVYITGSRPARDATMALVPYMRYFSFSGLSTDTKPTEVHDGNDIIQICSGSCFLEVDTGNVKTFNADAGTWSEV